MRGLHVSLNYPYINIKNMFWPENARMQHYTGTNYERGVKDFLKGGESKKGVLFEKGG